MIRTEYAKWPIIVIKKITLTEPYLAPYLKTSCAALTKLRVPYHRSIWPWERTGAPWSIANLQDSTCPACCRPTKEKRLWVHAKSTTHHAAPELLFLTLTTKNEHLKFMAVQPCGPLLLRSSLRNNKKTTLSACEINEISTFLFKSTFAEARFCLMFNHSQRIFFFETA